MKLLKIRAFAWLVAILIMILSVALGAYTSYAGMQSSAAAAFEREMMPIINNAMISAYEMQSAAQNYLSAAELATIGISRIVADIQATDDTAQIYRLFVQLNQAVWTIYDMVPTLEISDINRGFIINSHGDFMQFDLILSQAGYNNIAADFNARLQSGLGFIVRPIINELPRFD